MSEETLTNGDPRGVFYDLFEEDEAAELAMRAQIVNAHQMELDTSHDSNSAPD